MWRAADARAVAALNHPHICGVYDVGEKTTYEQFFAFWKDADDDVPLLVQARKEFAELSRQLRRFICRP